jgi:hypothetical protein
MFSRQLKAARKNYCFTRLPDVSPTRFTNIDQVDFYYRFKNPILDKP